MWTSSLLFLFHCWLKFYSGSFKVRSNKAPNRPKVPSETRLEQVCWNAAWVAVIKKQMGWAGMKNVAVMVGGKAMTGWQRWGGMMTCWFRSCRIFQAERGFSKRPLREMTWFLLSANFSSILLHVHILKLHHNNTLLFCSFTSVTDQPLAPLPPADLPAHENKSRSLVQLSREQTRGPLGFPGLHHYPHSGIFHQMPEVAQVALDQTTNSPFLMPPSMAKHTIIPRVAMWLLYLQRLWSISWCQCPKTTRVSLISHIQNELGPLISSYLKNPTVSIL